MLEIMRFSGLGGHFLRRQKLKRGSQVLQPPLLPSASTMFATACPGLCPVLGTGYSGNQP